MAATLMLLVAGCSKVIDGHAVIGAPKPGTPVTWKACESASSDATDIPAGAECGVLSVPVDYSKPDGDIAQLAMIRFKATGNKIGSLILNPGGPGESGVEAAASIVGTMPESVRQRFDVVGFDPRGVGSSTPAVWCNSDADNDRLRADPQVDYSPAGVAHIESETKDFVQRCVDKMGKDFLANVGTASVAKDLDAMRIALGDQKLTYLGYSYGTRIGSAYAEAYPQNVRAMILDGAVDPNADPIESDIRQAAAFQTAFNDYAADCAKAASCPLGTDPAKAVDVYKSLVDPLVQNPAKTKDPRGLSYSDSVVGTILPLYSPNLWRHLTQALTELKRGDGDTMLALADLYMGRDEKGHYNNSTDVRVAVNCVDEPPVTDRAKTVDEDRRSREVAPFMSYGQFTGNAPLSTCAFWPVPPTSTPHQLKIDGLPPTLVVSTTNDPATPYQAGVDLAKQLGGALLTFDGTQHTVVFQGNACVDDIAAKYLVDVAVPPPGAKC
ncbi:MAG: tripeptidyl-peptidase Serine peptidase family [Mycobacterium sp.]|nr:tripeptidyl-peptidase Serine peptidase family [Mycobacterium sp.]